MLLLAHLNCINNGKGLTMINVDSEYNYTYIPNRNPWREFVTEKWYQHKDEIYTWTNKPLTEYDFSEYFRNNKWFLKKQFKKLKEEND